MRKAVAGFSSLPASRRGGGGGGAAGGRLRGSSCRTADLHLLLATPVLATLGTVWGNEVLTELG
jgi:hypothetical protein